MLLLIHISAALAGIALTTVSFLQPSLNRIRTSYLMVMLTIASGTVIIIKDHLSILSVCLSGLLYVGFTVSGLAAASRRLSRQNYKND